jgi:hypothetical protein
MTNQQHSNKQKEKKNYIHGKIKYIHAKTKQTNKIKQTKRQTECLSTPPNLNDTLSQMWQEIHYSGMRNQDVQSPRHPPNLNIKHLSNTNSNLFFSKIKHQRLIAVRN